MIVKFVLKHNFLYQYMRNAFASDLLFGILSPKSKVSHGMVRKPSDVSFCLTKMFLPYNLSMHSAPEIVLVKFMGLQIVLCFELVQCLFPTKCSQILSTKCQNELVTFCKMEIPELQQARKVWRHLVVKLDFGASWSHFPPKTMLIFLFVQITAPSQH